MPDNPILVVDDDPDIRELLTALLELEGFDVNSAPDGAAALDLMKRLGPPPLLLLDLMMPVMDGYQVLDAMARGKLSDIPVLVFSAVLQPKTLAKYSNIAGSYRKPGDFDMLLDKVKEIALPLRC